jgi:hypothetical protein
MLHHHPAHLPEIRVPPEGVPARSLMSWSAAPRDNFIRFGYRCWWPHVITAEDCGLLVQPSNWPSRALVHAFALTLKQLRNSAACLHNCAYEQHVNSDG